MNLLLDPKIFNYVIIGMFVAAAVRWAYAGNMPQAGYWASAALLNVFVTIGGK